MANCVVLVPADAVGAAGVPVKVGLLMSALEEIAEATAVNSVSISVPLIILPELPLGSESLAVKFVALTYSLIFIPLVSNMLTKFLNLLQRHNL